LQSNIPKRARGILSLVALSLLSRERESTSRPNGSNRCLSKGIRRATIKIFVCSERNWSVELLLRARFVYLMNITGSLSFRILSFSALRRIYRLDSTKLHNKFNKHDAAS